MQQEVKLAHLADVMGMEYASMRKVAVGTLAGVAYKKAGAWHVPAEVAAAMLDTFEFARANVQSGEALAMLGLTHHQQLSRFIAAGRIEARKYNGRLYVSRESIKRYNERQARKEAI